MKTDRELVELAAKAAGINLHSWGEKGNENFADMDFKPYGCLWNPLISDGDAFRLAVKLNLNIRHDENCVTASITDGPFSTEFYFERSKEKADSTRQAIVRAAAQIGESKA